MKTENRLTLENDYRLRVNLMESVLRDMPNKFTSDKFCKVLRSLGYPDKNVKYGEVGEWLKGSVIQDENSSRVWYKVHVDHKPEKSAEAVKDLDVVEPKVVKPNTQFTIEDAINEEIENAVKLLKRHGYKVYKPVSQWVEIK